MTDSNRAIYFAYGSNLLYARLHARTPSIKNLGMARLSSHRLSFNKPGGDGSGKCGIEPVDSNEYVLGVLYEMDREEKPALDHIEGVGHGYVDQTVKVSFKDTVVNAFTYYPSRLDCVVLPFDWYKAFVLFGARQNNFPDKYISLIDSVECQADPDTKRRKENLEIVKTHLLLDRGNRSTCYI